MMLDAPVLYDGDGVENERAEQALKILMLASAHS
jgi:hypothetical protein